MDYTLAFPLDAAHSMYMDKITNYTTTTGTLVNDWRLIK